MSAGDYASACPKLEASQRLRPAAGTLLNLALCEENLGKLASAWAHFLEAAQLMGAGDDRVQTARDHAKALEPRLPRLSLRLPQGAPPGLRIERGKNVVPNASLGVPIPVDPGEHVIVVSTEDGRRREQRVTLKEGEARDVLLKLPAASSPAVAPASTGADPVRADSANVFPEETSETSSPVLGYVVGSVGLLGVALGAVTASLAHAKRDSADPHCPNKRCDAEGDSLVQEGQQLATVSVISYVIGAVGLLSGSYLILSHSEPRQVGVSVHPAGGGLSFRTRF